MWRNRDDTIREEKTREIFMIGPKGCKHKTQSSSFLFPHVIKLMKQGRQHMYSKCHWKLQFAFARFLNTN